MGGAKDSLKVSISYPHFKLDFEGKSSHLGEVRRIVEAVADNDSFSIEDASLFEAKARLTEAFFQHPPLLNRLKSSLVLDEDVRILKHILPLEQEYDLNTGKETTQVNMLNVKAAVNALFDDLEPNLLTDCLVHVHGDLAREQQNMIMDSIKQRLGMQVKTRFFLTKQNLEGNVLLEAVCFGANLE